MKAIEPILNSAIKEHRAKIEAQLAIRIQPKPWYLPAFFWKIILKRVLVIKYFKDEIIKM